MRAQVPSGLVDLDALSSQRERSKLNKPKSARAAAQLLLTRTLACNAPSQYVIEEEGAGNGIPL